MIFTIGFFLFSIGATFLVVAMLLDIADARINKTVMKAFWSMGWALVVGILLMVISLTILLAQKGAMP